MEKSVLEKIGVPKVENHYNMTSTNKQYPAPSHGGRVPSIMTETSSARPYLMYKEGTPVFDRDDRRELVGHMHEKTPLNVVFFSEGNLDHLQRAIQQQVRLMSQGKYIIDRQNEDDLKIIMRSYYLMFGKNNPLMVAKELEDLNSRVVGYASGKIYSEVDFHMFYRKDLEDFAPPIANPMNVHIAGTRGGELKTFF